MKTLLVATCVADFEALSGAPRDTIELVLAPTKQDVALLLASTAFDRAATLVSDLDTDEPVDVCCVLDARHARHTPLRYPFVQKAGPGDAALVYRDPVLGEGWRLDLEAARGALCAWWKEQRTRELKGGRDVGRHAGPLRGCFETRDACVCQVIASAPDGVVIVGCSPESRSAGVERLLQRL